MPSSILSRTLCYAHATVEQWRLFSTGFRALGEIFINTKSVNYVLDSAYCGTPSLLCCACASCCCCALLQPTNYTLAGKPATRNGVWASNYRSGALHHHMARREGRHRRSLLRKFLRKLPHNATKETERVWALDGGEQFTSTSA